MSVPHVLLLQQGPRTSDAGEIFLDELCQVYPLERLSRFVLTEEPISSLPQRWKGNVTAYVRLPKEYGILRFGTDVAKLTSAPFHYYTKAHTVPRLIIQAAQFGFQRSVDLVWVPLSCPSLIYLARRVASRLGVPLVVTVWDPPEHFSETLGLDPLSRHSLLKEFGEVLRSAVRCSVISEEMRSYYQCKYGIDSMVLRHGILRKLRRPGKKWISDSGSLMIGFCGSLYAGREMEALISALSSVNWKLDNRKITLRIVTPQIYWRSVERISINNRNIEFRGWCSQDDAIELMTQADITYLPYWFDKRYETSVRLCFPSKLTAYLAAGRPVLYHGPNESAVVKFFSRYPVGLGCHFLEPAHILRSILRFIREGDLYSSAVEAGQKALDEELNAQVFVHQFASLIGVEMGLLLTESPNFSLA